MFPAWLLETRGLQILLASHICAPSSCGEDLGFLSPEATWTAATLCPVPAALPCSSSLLESLFDLDLTLQHSFPSHPSPLLITCLHLGLQPFTLPSTPYLLCLGNLNSESVCPDSCIISALKLLCNLKSSQNVKVSVMVSIICQLEWARMLGYFVKHHFGWLCEDGFWMK